MAAEKLMLKGRHLSKVAKYAIGTGVACVVGGVVTYVVVRQRISASHEYAKSLTDKTLKSVDERVMKFAGFKRNPKFPHLTFLNNEEGAYDEYFKKFDEVDKWLFIEKHVLSTVDSNVKEYFPDLFFYGIRNNWFDNDDKKEQCQLKLAKARVMLSKKVQQDIEKSMEEKEEKEIDYKEAEELLVAVEYLHELYYQSAIEVQNEPIPLAVSYLPKEPTE